MFHIVRVLVAVIAAAVAFAAPAAADLDGFVKPLQTKYVFLSEEQLLDEGSKVCSALNGGMNAADAAIMVRSDLGVSVSAAGDIVSAAVVQLDCSHENWVTTAGDRSVAGVIRLG